MVSPEERLADLLVRWEDECSSDAPPHVEEFCQSHECSDLLDDFRELVASLEPMALVGGTEIGIGPHGDDGAPPVTTRFQVKRELGRGGLGVVYLAQDLELGRDVALKAMRSAAAADPGARERFSREAKLTGRLDHPGVVAVHDLAHAGGDPYYTMRVISGESLREAIEHLHGASPIDPVALRRLLRGFISACAAVAYAHSKNIIHRDLKPHNIMLGDYGETLVIDWGLANERGVRNAECGVEENLSSALRTPHSALDETPLPPPETRRSGYTAMGQAMGTWAYMSPEQARGDWDRVGPASDVFSLGATLYQILTGKTPYATADMPADVLAGRFPPATSIGAGVSKALDAVCQKAMAFDPSRRYADARDLAADVERWLVDEPVSAYRDPLMVRARRWAKRHRTFVTSGLALLVTAIVGLSAGLFFVNREKNRTEAQRVITKGALDEKTVAEQHTREALGRVTQAQLRTRQALDEMTDIGAERQLTGQRKLSASDQAFLTRALGHYRDFAAEAGNTREMREAIAHAHFRTAYILMRLGQRSTAEPEYRESLRQYTALIGEADEHNGNELRYMRSRVMNNLALLKMNAGRPREAEEMFLQLEKELTNLVPYLSPQLSIRVRQTLAYATNSLGKLQLTGAHFDESTRFFRRAAEMHRLLAIENPKNPAHVEERARTLTNIASNLLRPPAKRTEAEELLREALQSLEQLCKEYPDEPNYVASRAKALATLANEAFLQFQMPRGFAMLRDAIQLMRPVVRDYPADTEFRGLLADHLKHVGMLQSRLPGQQAEGEVHLLEAEVMLNRLIEDDPTAIDPRLNRGMVRYALGGFQRRRDPAASARFFDGAVEDLQAVIDGGNEGRVAPPLLPVIHWNRADLALAAGDHEKAAAAAVRLRELTPAPASGALDAARYLVRAAILAAGDTKLPWWQRFPLAERRAVTAVEFLHVAVKAGFKNAATLRGPDFAPLQGRPNFQRLVRSLENK